MRKWVPKDQGTRYVYKGWRHGGENIVSCSISDEFWSFCDFGTNKDLNTLFSADKVKVTFNNAKKGNQLTIKDANGTILHSEEILKKGTLVKTFNLSELENGIYTLELEKDFQIVVKSVKVNNRNVTFLVEAEKLIFKPIVRNKENKLMITKIAFDEEPLKISIYYKNEII